MRVVQTDDAPFAFEATYQNQYGEQHIPGFQRRSFLGGVVLLRGSVFAGDSLAVTAIGAFVDLSFAFRNQHRTKITATVDQSQHQNNHKNRVVAVLDALQEHSQTGGLDTNIVGSGSFHNDIELCLDESHFESDPTGDWRKTGNGSGRGVDDEGELFARNVE
jgi:hypothetical protein